MYIEIKELCMTYFAIGLGCSIGFWLSNVYMVIYDTHLYNRVFETNVNSVIDVRKNINSITYLSIYILFLWPYTYTLFFILILCYSFN